MDINSLLSNVLSGLSGDAARYTDAASSIGQAATGMETANTAAIDQARADIPQAQGVAQGVADINYTNAQLIQKLQQDAMLNPAQVDNAYTAGLAELTDINMARKAAASEVTALSSTNLLDDPFGYVMAQINMPVAQARLAGLDQQANIVTNDVQTRLNLSKAAQSTVVADTMAQTKALAYKDAELKANAARMKLDIAGAEVKSKVAGEMLRQADTLAKITSGKVDVYKMVNSAEQWEMSRQDRIDARNLAAEERTKYSKAAKDVEAINTARLANLQASYTLLGLTPPTDLVTYDKSQNTPQKKAISDITLNGNLGGTLKDSLTTFMAAAPNMNAIVAQGNPGFALMAQGLNKGTANAISKARKQIDATGKSPSNAQSIDLGFNSYETGMVSSMGDVRTAAPLTDALWDTEFNPYKADHKRMVSNNAKGLLTNNVVMELAKTIAPTVPTDVPQFRGADEQQMLRTLAEMAVTGKININDAAKQTVEYYKTSAIINEDFYQYTLMGLPKQTSYMVKVKIPGFFSDTVVPASTAVDLMNETDVKRLLLSITTANRGTPALSMGDMSIGGFR